MRHSSSRKIERWFKTGPAYLLLRLLLSIRKVSADELRTIEPEKILLVKIHHKIGDLLLATPVLTALRARFPDARIDFLAGTYNVPAIRNNRFLDNVHTFNKKRISSWIRTIINLRSVRYDLAIVASASSFSTTNAVLARLCGPKVLIGYKAPYTGVPDRWSITRALYSHMIGLPDPSIHETDYNLGYIAPLDCPIPNRDETVHFSAGELSFAEEWYRSAVPPAARFRIGIHAGGTFSDRQWPIAHFARLAAHLLDNPAVFIILFNGKGEHATLTVIKEHLSTCPEETQKRVVTIPDCSFREFTALQSKLDLYIGNDTGTLHSAAASGCAAIGIFTATLPSRWAPLNSGVTSLVKPAVEEVAEVAKRYFSVPARRQERAANRRRTA